VISNQIEIRAGLLTRSPTADYSAGDVGTLWPAIKRAKGFRAQR
jgi:hypothetical protein